MTDTYRKVKQSALHLKKGMVLIQTMPIWFQCNWSVIRWRQLNGRDVLVTKVA